MAYVKNLNISRTRYYILSKGESGRQRGEGEFPTQPSRYGCVAPTISHVQWLITQLPSKALITLQQDQAGKTVTLFPDISQSAVPLILMICHSIVIWYVHVLTYVYFDQRSLAQTYQWWRCILFWIVHNHCALSPFMSCRKCLCWKNLPLSKSCMHPNKTLKEGEIQRAWTQLLYKCKVMQKGSGNACPWILRTELRDHVNNLRKGLPHPLLILSNQKHI